MNPLLFLGLLAVGVNYWPYVEEIIDGAMDKVYYVVNPPVKAETHTTLAEEIIARNEAKKEEKEQRAEEIKGTSQYDWIEI